MKLGHCPVCRTELTLEAVLADEVMGEIATITHGMDKLDKATVVQYLNLFRTAKQHRITNIKALDLLRKALDQFDDHPRMFEAMRKAVEAQYSKAQKGGTIKPLKLDDKGRHAYLVPIYENTPSPVPAQHSGAVVAEAQSAPRTTQRGKMLQEMESRLLDEPKK